MTMPTGDLPGWHLSYSQDFNTPAAAGTVGSVYGSAMRGYSGFGDTSGHGQYDPDTVLSVHDSMLDWFIHTDAGVHKVAAPVPMGYAGQTYGRYSVRLKSDNLPGYKIAFLLWPTSDQWTNEVDWPEVRSQLVPGVKAQPASLVTKQAGDPAVFQPAVSVSSATDLMDWHVATTEWTPTSVKWYWDDILVGQTDSVAAVPNQPMRWTLRAETQTGGAPLDATSGHILVDWLAAWSYDPSITLVSVLEETPTSFAPASRLADTSLKRKFYGTKDPSKTAGVVLARGDKWRSTAPPANAPVPFPTFTDFPVIRWQDLYVSGDHAGQTLNRLTVNAYVTLPDLGLGYGFDQELVDFTQGGAAYSCYAPKCMGIWGPGPDRARFRLRPNSMGATALAKIPNQATQQGSTNPLYLMRLGPADGVHGIHSYGFTLEGTDQAIDPNTGVPACFNGYFDYNGNVGSTEDWMLIKAIRAHYSAPPGETNALNTYRTTNSKSRFLEIDGINRATGERVGGANGHNGAVNVWHEDFYWHDSGFSSATFATSGSAATGIPTNGVTLLRGRIINQANHGGAGGGFPGLNFEGVIGPILLQGVELLMDPSNSVNPHLKLSSPKDNPSSITFIFDDKTKWHPESSPTLTNGCLWVKIPPTYGGVANAVTTVPRVECPPGNVLTAVSRSVSNPNPNTQYILDRT